MDFVLDIVSIVAIGRWKERKEPQAGHAEFGEIIQAIAYPHKIADAIAISILKRGDIDTVDDRVLIPRFPSATHVLPVLPEVPANKVPQSSREFILVAPPGVCEPQVS